jgi:hypothetical protein
VAAAQTHPQVPYLFPTSMFSIPFHAHAKKRGHGTHII